MTDATAFRRISERKATDARITRREGRE